MNLANLPPMGQKVERCVSPVLRKFAKGKECALRMPWCNRDTATVVHCHIRAFGTAGIGIKPHDFQGYHGCSECHRRELDAGWDDILRALIITQERLHAAGILQIGKPKP